MISKNLQNLINCKQAMFLDYSWFTSFSFTTSNVHNGKEFFNFVLNIKQFILILKIVVIHKTKIYTSFNF